MFFFDLPGVSNKEAFDKVGLQTIKSHNSQGNHVVVPLSVDQFIIFQKANIENRKLPQTTTI